MLYSSSVKPSNLKPVQAENVPAYPIDIANRWGAQVFALSADGYDTLEFFDPTVHESEDNGLLSWLTGTVSLLYTRRSQDSYALSQLLKTAVSTLHMLRYSSQTFTFHLIPSPRPPPLPPIPTSRSKHFLWDGFGSMVLVNKNEGTDRSMLIEIRPPSVLDSSTIKEFAKTRGGEGWWPYDKETWIGDVGQANILQAQVYDSCVQNQVYFFAVTNLRYWVFGQFDANYTSCAVGPLIDRKSREPSLMQCLTAWVIRSVDERPRAHHSQHRPTTPTTPHPSHTPHISQSLRPMDTQAPPYAEGSRRRKKRHQSLPINNIYDDFSPGNPSNYFIGSMQQGMNMMPDYYHLSPGLGHMANTPYPQPSSAPSMTHSTGWGQRPFLPNVGGQIPYNSGLSWYGSGMPSWPGMG
ncbi:hypothetical protein C361_05410 [Cryptococcus neoformans Tu259-1]|uniref:Uncharacterized protein n=1 Tax=Cryptococcus neoformans Tu259-1 TaxID=1230072 RepID=A0A854Q9I9_CRYNE|nr:hypothetical protein C361_05410 [Cryptococcus neoformans var. grubii Tu259-1]